MSGWAIDERLVAGFGALAFASEDVKLFITHSVAFSQDAIQIVAGVVILFVSALLLRKPVSSIWPWLVVLLLASLNAFFGLSADRLPEPSVQPGKSARDLLLTMVVPTLILLSTRLAPHLYRPPSGR